MAKLKLMDAFSSSKPQVVLQFSSCKSHFRTVSVSSFFSIYEVKIIVTILCEVEIIVAITAQSSYKLCLSSFFSFML